MEFVCRLEELANKTSWGVEIKGQPLVIIHLDGKINVYRNHCPHLGISLEYLPDQFLDPEHIYIQCANHGALFEIATGACVAGPCAGQSLQRIVHTIQDNQLFVDLGDNTPLTMDKG